MGDSGRVVSVRLPDETLDKLDRVVELERSHARPGHKVARASLIALAVELYVGQRLRRHVSRETVSPSQP